MRAAVYQLRIGPLYYVGQSSQMLRRLADHRCFLVKGTHSNPVLQAAYNQYKDLQIDILEYVEHKMERLETERFWIKYQKHTGKELLNIYQIEPVYYKGYVFPTL